MNRAKQVDKILLVIVAILLLVGFLIFTSASLGLLARSGAKFSSIALNQFLSILLGISVAYVVSKIHYTFWRKWSFCIFLISVAITLLVFVPKFGLQFGGGKRWIALGSYSFQPAELLKIGFVIYCAAWIASARARIMDWKRGLLPVLILLAVVGAILLKQPDTGTFLSIFIATMGMFVAAGGRLRHLFVLIFIGLIGLVFLIYTRPYLMERIVTFLNPTRDSLGAGYQIQQSLIAVGSGEFFGRGFGQSVQKFSFLPEPVGDSIFAVAAEEFGFVGSITFILLFLFFTMRALRIASTAPDMFGGLLTVGIVILIVSGSFINIGSMIGVIPLSGEPLAFVSHGGSAMLFTLIEVGIILNISRFKKT